VIHTDVLRFRRGKYFWWALLLSGVAAGLYGTQRAVRPPSGDTWQGYVLGTVGAGLIGWLTLLGIRKRRYSSTVGTLQGWTSAHIYLGMALLVVATLHCAFQFGFNVHTLAYVLMCLVIGSGIFGLFVYLNAPTRLAENRQGASRGQLFAELFEVGRQARAVSERCLPAVHTAVDSSIERTTIGGGAWAQLFSVDHSRFLRADKMDGTPALAKNADQQAVLDFVAARIPRADRSEETARLQELLLLLARRQVILRRLRSDIRLSGWLKVWLFFHTRVTAALLIALIIHIVVTVVTYR
jgi:hypothetical protein